MLSSAGGSSLHLFSPEPRRVNVRFRVGYPTRWGQNLMVVGAGALMGNWSVKRGHIMKCHHEKEQLVWEALVSLPWQPVLSYKYVIVSSKDNENEVEKWEKGEREVALHEELLPGAVVELIDNWSDRSYPGSIFSTRAFTNVVWAHKADHQPSGAVARCIPAPAEAIVRFQIGDWLLEEGETPCVMGSIPHLGNWHHDHMLKLTETSTPLWEAEIRIPYSQFPFTYKYAVVAAEGNVLDVEVGESRVVALQLPGSSTAGGEVVAAPAMVVRHDGYFRRERLWRGAGVAVPVFSLRSSESVGAGEFLDLIKLADFSAACGMRIIQILPVNDTSVYRMWWDSYPYSTISVFALHPLYLRLQALREQLPEDIAHDIEVARMELDQDAVDYEATITTKLKIARRVFDVHGHETTASKEFEEWFACNSTWLQPYAAFCFLRDMFGTSEHWRWGALSVSSPDLIARLTAPECEYHAAIRFTYYVQYHLHLQLQKASLYCESRKVILKGDLPIGVDKRSVDTWLSPSLFRMDQSTGSPPDYFDPKGQNWGFPTYNWEEMAKDGYGWWRQRLHHLSQYFHAYRIDHVLGFFRIWEIPGDCVTGILGHFRPSIPISRTELQQRGMNDVDRLCEPYVRPHLLEKIFGETASEITARYFVEAAPGMYRFRPQYSSERSIASISTRADSPQWLVDEVNAPPCSQEVEDLKKGLLVLRQNVLLLRHPTDPDSFYPRFAMSGCSSFKELDPAHSQALQRLHDDYFYKRQEDTWRAHALRTLPVLMDSTDMLLCGEDLGFVPACVAPVMAELGLIGLRIQRMPGEPGREFGNPASYPYLSVASPSCHDVQPLRAWYEADADRRERFFYTALSGSGTAPENCTPDIVRQVLQQHLNCPSVLSIFPIQDVMALSPEYTTRPAAEEAINDPTVGKHYWRFRLHVTLEDLLADKALTQQLHIMLSMSDRCGLHEEADS